jgi:type I restriction enzyme S subunit
MGKVALNKVTCVTNQQINSIILNKDFNADFIYYVISSMQGYLRNLATGGSTMPIVNKSDFENITINAPDLPTQTAIAEILSSLDDKIELNNKINQELETLAQTLFKQWFIDYEFPNENEEPYNSFGGEMTESELGEIPKGWKIDSLDNIAEFLNGLALQKFPAESDYEFLPIIKIRELRQKDTSNSDKASVNLPEKYIINDDDILVFHFLKSRNGLTKISFFKDNLSELL